MFLRNNDINKEELSAWLLSDNKVFVDRMFVEIFKRRHGKEYWFVWSVFTDETGTWTKRTRYFWGVFERTWEGELRTTKLQ